ncbi:oxidoreductase [Chloroflexi bacterium TSY]|nr:oxidoreductase [Chloroflexi bacterium TSY]
MSTKQKVTLVTGASAGIGKETAKQLLEDGLTVYVAARRTEKMADLAELGAHVLKMDVTIEEDMINGIAAINEAHGGVDVLVNNAGYAIYGAVEETTIDDARRQFEVNIFGLARLTQLVLPHMREQKSGTIINISSVGGKIYTPLGAWYHATKHALEGWSDSLRLEGTPFGIDVVIVEPGGIKTEFADVMTGPMMERSGEGPYRDLAQSLSNSMTQMESRMSEPSVIADVVSQAVKARRPKTRYAAGAMAKQVLFMRSWLPDRAFDWVVTRMV